MFGWWKRWALEAEAGLQAGCEKILLLRKEGREWRQSRVEAERKAERKADVLAIFREGRSELRATTGATIGG